MKRSIRRPGRDDNRRGRSGVVVDEILQGDCVQVLAGLPEAWADLVFADPPYNLQLSQELWRPNQTRVEGVDEAWDRFAGFSDYDEFTRAWLTACRRALKPTGSLWVIGTYHNIYRVGAILQDLGFWILNDVIWIKTNPMPNFRGVRFANAHETLLWAVASRRARYTFQHRAMKALNDGLQMRSDWILPICSGSERLRLNGSGRSGEKAHATQKPEALLYRVLLASTRPGDVVLDPFFGTGTTGAVARRLGRHWVGIEREARYIRLARARIDGVAPAPQEGALLETPEPRRQPRLPFGALLEAGLLRPGQRLFFRGDRRQAGVVRADGTLVCRGRTGSIHQMGSHLSGGAPCNGWTQWHYEAESGEMRPIDVLRQTLRAVGAGGEIALPRKGSSRSRR
jgi:modification methylase